MKHIAIVLVVTAMVLSPGQGRACPAGEEVRNQATGTINYITTEQTLGILTLSEPGHIVPIVVSEDEYRGVTRVAGWLQEDLYRVTGNKPVLVFGEAPASRAAIIAGTIGTSNLIDNLILQRKIDVADLAGRWESSLALVVDKPFEGLEKALVIVGSDKRGTIFGLLDLSRNIGVSPWYWWADVPVRQQPSLYVRGGRFLTPGPKVKYRGIFLNDEAPALSGYAHQVFGGFNHRFYEKVFELILRLRGNFLWPAMWGNAFFDDDPLNGNLADEYGIVIGTSHHEPMGRAHDEWRRYGSGEWDYSRNSKVLSEFWKTGIERMKNWETLVTIGMRGDGDEPMSAKSNRALLEKIVNDQRKIIARTTARAASETPQVWAIYKEVQDYYDSGMRVPDDVTLLFCDDNWGNVRKLPDVEAAKRPGGYGMYYHFDYVGGPRNYKWLNVSQVSRIWEQMNLTWEHGVDRIWVVNVGDLKPMEYPITFFLDMAWDPEAFNASNLTDHTVAFCKEQFGGHYPEETARMIDLYTLYNHRVTPELLDAATFSLHNYNEFETVVNDYKKLLLDAYRLNYLMPEEYRDAFDQLVLFPIEAMANLYEMYYATARNHDLAASGNPEANAWADQVAECFRRDSLLTIHYNQVIAGGKWPHMMDQTRIGYTYWQQPPRNVMPEVLRAPESTLSGKSWLFRESGGYVSIEAEHYTRAMNHAEASWLVIPGLGRTLSALTTTPVIHKPRLDASSGPWVEYDVFLETTGQATLILFLSPTLNYNDNKGLRYAVSVNGQKEQIVNFNKTFDQEQHDQWLANSIIRSETVHRIDHPGKNTIRFRAIEPGIVLQKLILDLGGLKPSFLGPPESQRMEPDEARPVE